MTCDMCGFLAYPVPHHVNHCQDKHVALMCGMQEIKYKGCDTAWICLQCAWDEPVKTTKHSMRLYDYDTISEKHYDTINARPRTIQGVCPVCVTFAANHWQRHGPAAESMCYPQRQVNALPRLRQQPPGLQVAVAPAGPPPAPPAPPAREGQWGPPPEAPAPAGPLAPVPAGPPALDLVRLVTQFQALETKVNKNDRRLKKVGDAVRNQRPLSMGSWTGDEEEATGANASHGAAESGTAPPAQYDIAQWDGEETSSITSGLGSAASYLIDAHIVQPAQPGEFVP